jgi:hypothetical protein
MEGPWILLTLVDSFWLGLGHGVSHVLLDLQTINLMDHFEHRNLIVIRFLS